MTSSMTSSNIARSPGHRSSGERLAGHRSECALGESELYLFKREELFILFGEGISGSVKS
jgi:hypothetical protein